MKTPILLVHHAAALGGAERSLLDLLACLDGDRYSALAAVPTGGPLADAARRAGAEPIPIPLRPPWRVRSSPIRLAGFALSLWRTRRVLEDIIRRTGARLVHANSDGAHLCAGPAARRTGIPAIWHSRDLIGLGGLGPWMARRADRVVAISECVAARLRREGVPRERLSIMPNAVNPVLFEPVPGRRERVRRELGLEPEAFVILMIAHFAPWKGHLTFLDAARRVAAARPDARFLIAGADLSGHDGAYARRLRAAAAAEPLAGRAFLLGARSDVPALLEAADALAHPAEREPFGRAVLEAMAAARPTVAAAACGPAELIRDGTDGLLVPPGDPAALAGALIRLAADRALAARLGANARERAAGSFSIARLRERVLSLYDGLLDAARPGPRSGGPE